MKDKKKKVKKETAFDSVKRSTKATGKELKEMGGLAKDSAGEFLNMITGIPSLPWKKLPLKGWLYIGIITFIAIAAIVFSFIGF